MHSTAAEASLVLLLLLGVTGCQTAPRTQTKMKPASGFSRYRSFVRRILVTFHIVEQVRLSVGELP